MDKEQNADQYTLNLQHKGSKLSVLWPDAISGAPLRSHIISSFPVWMAEDWEQPGLNGGTQERICQLQDSQHCQELRCPSHLHTLHQAARGKAVHDSRAAFWATLRHQASSWIIPAWRTAMLRFLSWTAQWSMKYLILLSTIYCTFCHRQRTMGCLQENNCSDTTATEDQATPGWAHFAEASPREQAPGCSEVHLQCLAFPATSSTSRHVNQGDIIGNNKETWFRSA